MPPAPGEAPREILPGVWWARQALSSRLDHVNQWILEDTGGVVLVDTGVDRSEAQKWWREALRPYGSVNRVLVTHHHYDHAGAAGFLCTAFHAPLWMTRTEWMAALARTCRRNDDRRQLESGHLSRNGLSAGEATRIGDHFESFRSRLSPIPGAYRRLVDGENIRIGGREWEIITGEGHAPEQMLLFCGEEKLLIAADQVLPGITPHVGVWANEPEANPLDFFLNSLDRLCALPHDTLVLPSHGEPFRGLHDRLRATRLHHEARLEQTKASCVEWRNAAEIMRVLFKPARDIQDVALGLSETLAHIHFLRDTGSIEMEVAASGARRFRLAA